jgi:hypothetical protein
MACKGTDLMTAKTVRRNRRLDGPMLGELERICFASLSDKLGAIMQHERAQTVTMTEALRTMLEFMEVNRGTDLGIEQEPTSPGRHLHPVK